MRLVRTVSGTTILITGTGKLADGTAVTFASNECLNREVPLHSVFASLNGSLLGREHRNGDHCGPA